VGVLVNMLQPFEGRVYDPCCGSGGMFLQSERFVEAHNGRRNDGSIFRQEIEPDDLAPPVRAPKFFSALWALWAPI
jgi:type I restriction-modification system DNA methylase subunit